MAIITATQIANELDISRSYLYYLTNNGAFDLNYIEGKPVWSAEVINEIKKYLDSKKVTDEKEVISPYKVIKINNRRYLGNKYKLLDFISEVVDSHCKDINTIADIFAGTGAVASVFIDKKVITNDLMYSNYMCHVAWFGNEEFSEDKIIDYIMYYNNMNTIEKNYMTENFANTFFSFDDCSKIGFIREDIEKSFISGKINERERALLITSLLYAMDKIANTCGHYDAYRRNAEFGKKIELSVPQPSKTNQNNICYNKDANELVCDIEVDLVYIDPPYNSRQYCDAYHVLENVAKWEKPEVFGVARKMDRTALKSDYCTIKATKVFEDLIKNIKAKYIVLSYNNMAEKGNDRSNAKISDDDIMRILEAKGEVQVFSSNYKAFTTGKSNISENQERLFVCKCFDSKKEIIQSPLNYIGGKFKLLPQILPQFPNDITTFIDLFSGGCNVGVNVDCRKVVFNDLQSHLLYLFNTFQNLDKESVFELIEKCINKYELSRSSEKGYNYYNCESGKGLGDYNKDRFLKLRKDFNDKIDNPDYGYYVMLYVMIVYSFNNQLRFNSKGEFNLPVGKRDFNTKMQSKLSKFIDRLKSSDYTFVCKDFKKINIEDYEKDTFVYADPPYLITCATYNEQGGWTEQSEKDLLAYLDNVHNKGYRFALSNVFESKGKRNEILINWAEKNKDKYRIIDLDFNYSNSNYQTKDRTNSSREVLIVNYNISQGGNYGK
ncbi:DNA adenine methylase [Candidatus Epulonipiscioides gigas]|nr:DNA adenine methylase [Epulopiscium sp. SCG-C07WGA-EpuloA2]